MIVFLLFLSLVNCKTHAQTLEPNWFNDKQQYIKIEVNKIGVYSLGIDEIGTLLPSIFNVTAKKLRLYYRGKSISFDISSKTELLKKEDKLFFFAEKNDGKYEAEFYIPSHHQPNTYSSLYTDVSVYYLTIASDEKEDQFINLEAITSDLKPLEQPLGNTIALKTQFYEALQVFSTDFTFNSVTGPVPYIQQSYFESGEGLTGSLIKEKVNYDIAIPLDNRISEDLLTEIQFNGRDNNFSKKINIKYGKIDTNIVINEFYTNTIVLKQKLYNLTETPTLRLYADGGAFSVNYIKSKYYRNIEFTGASGYTYISQKTNATIEVQKSFGNNYRVWNITNTEKVSEAYNLGINQYRIETKNSLNRYFYFSDYQKPLKISLFIADMTLFIENSDYLIISSKSLKESADKYAEFRSSEKGNNYNVELVFIEDLYEQFNFGIKNPIAIRNYIKYKLKTSKPKYLLLIGKAFSAYTGINSPNDLVPSFGYPASDILLTSGIITNMDVPSIPTGRIPALTNQEVLNYLEKVIQKIDLKVDMTQKNIIHLNGGNSFSQIETWSSHMTDLASIAKKSTYAVNITSKKKQILDPKEPAEIAKNLNEGVSLVSFLGHSSYQLIDLNIDFVSNPLLGYDNKRYPVLYMNGCAFNNYFREIPTLSKDWIFTPGKGAIATIGQSYYGYPIALTKHAEIFYDLVFNSDIEPSIGDAMKAAAEKISLNPLKNEYDILNNHQTVIFGDPAIKILNYSKPDLKIENAEYSESANSKLTLHIANQGKIVKDKKLFITLILKNSFSRDTLKFEKSLPSYRDTLIIPISTTTFISEIEISLDPNNIISEIDENNNKQKIIINQPSIQGDRKIPSALVLLQEQNPYNNIKITSNANFKINLIDDQELTYANNPDKYFTIYLKKTCDSCEYQKIEVSKYPFQVIIKNNKVLELNLLFENLKPGIYEMVIIVQDKAGNSTRENPYILSFEVSTITGADENKKIQFHVYPNPSLGCINFESNHKTSNNLNYSIYNGTTGALVAAWKDDKNEKQIWCNDKPGSYIYKITELNFNKSEVLSNGKFIILK